jgi:hypothetical protein
LTGLEADHSTPSSLTVNRLIEKLPLLLMVETSDPNKIIAGLALAGLSLAGLWRLCVWVGNASVKPDPWSTEIEASLHGENATSMSSLS